MKNIIILLLITLVISSTGVAQKKDLKKGAKNYKKGKYEEAMKYYTKALNKGAKLNDDVKEQIANCYYFLADYSAAKEFYNEVDKEKISTQAAVNYAQLLQMSEDYEKAISYYNVAISKGHKDPMLKSYKSSCQYAMSDPGNGDYELEASGLSISTYSYGVQFYKDGIIYSNKNPKGEKDPLGKFYTDLYYADFKDGAIGAKRIYNEKLVFDDAHEGAISFSPDFRKLCITKIEFSKSTPKLSIVEATNDAGTWKDIKPLPFVTDKYNYGYPAFSPDGNTLYFSSDMPGGKGGMDLYMVTKETGTEKWSLPINLGSTVNTPGDEIYAFVSAAGELFFSSNGHPGLGGMDVFYAIGEGKEWLNVTNLKKPVNSPMDDFAFVWSDEFEQGFFSTNRNRNPDRHIIYKVTVSPDKSQGLSDFLSTPDGNEDADLSDFLNDGSEETDAATDEDDAFANAITDLTEETGETESQGNFSSMEEQLKALRGDITYRVQFLSSHQRLDKLEALELGEDKEMVYRYFYQGLWRYTVGEFYDPEPAIDLKDKLVGLGYKDAFVAAFKDEERALDVQIYK